MKQPYQVDITVNGEVLTLLADTTGEVMQMVYGWMRQSTDEEFNGGFTIKVTRDEYSWGGKLDEVVS